MSDVEATEHIQTIRTPAQMKFTKDTCPDVAKHTKCPSSYAQWDAWAEKKARRHVQTMCPTCGLYTIWKRKPKEARRD